MAQRDGKGRFVKGGGSGNPAGRPANAGVIGELRKAIADALPGVLRRMVQEALNGDTAAGLALLSRFVPPIKPTDAPIVLPSPDDASPSDILRATLAAVARGELTPEQGRTVANIAATLARVDELEGLREKVSTLEGKPFTIRIEREEYPLPHHNVDINDWES